jgi:hypothetical protein
VAKCCTDPPSTGSNASRCSDRGCPRSGRPAGRTLKLEQRRREQLDPVGDELALGGLAHLAGLGIETEAPGPSSGNTRGPHVAVPSADGSQRLGDPTSDELVVARSLRTFAPLDPSLAVLTGPVPGLLTRQKLGEHVRLALPR